MRAPLLGWCTMLALRTVGGAGLPSRASTARLLSTAPPVSQTHKDAMAFLDGSPDPFHACARAAQRLQAAGFIELDEREAWAGRISPGGRYFWTRNRSCLVAFAVGEGYQPGDGFKIIGAHTDSPNLKVKPRSMRDGSAAGCTQVILQHSVCFVPALRILNAPALPDGPRGLPTIQTTAHHRNELRLMSSAMAAVSGTLGSIGICLSLVVWLYGRKMARSSSACSESNGRCCACPPWPSTCRRQRSGRPSK